MKTLFDCGQTDREPEATSQRESADAGWLSFQRHVEAIWFLEYTANNISEDDISGDGTNRIVRTQPFGARIRVSALAVLERDDAPDAPRAWRAKLMFRYWGSCDPLGRDDHKSFYVYGGNDLQKLQSTVSSGLSAVQRHMTADEAVVTPLRYVSVGGSGAMFADALQSVGLGMTPHDTGQTPTASEIRRSKRSVFSSIH